MSIVAERPVSVQVRQSGQTAQVPGKRLSLKAQRKLRGEAIRGNGPGGRRLGRGEDVPLSPEASVRLGELFAEYGDGLVHYARRKLMNRGCPAGVAVHLAEEITQEAWVEIARTGAKDLLAPDAGERYSAEETRWMLWRRVKDRILAHYKRSSSYETAVDWGDKQTCAVLCPLLEEALTERCQIGALTGPLARMVAVLPEAEREALLTLAYAVPEDRARELLRDVGAVGKREKLVARAILLLLIDNPELCGPRIPLRDLEEWERTALLHHVSWAQRQLLLRLEDLTRQILLLHLVEDLTTVQIAERLDVPRSRVLSVVSGCAALVAGVEQ
ncbi:sigma factor-like helix-turn-helix DNA-binding protein [Streptomyces olivaceoviridis]|uniref:sigma factor-like helix-turn-helix DNA-binding protein n=1 Tax=Streptomyces olivaceoviridis TaxID=1921 RepID=UPI0037A71583